MSYKNYLQAALALSFIWIFKRLGLYLGAKLAGVAVHAFGRFTREHKLADANMAVALPDMTAHQRKIALRDMWHNIGHVLAEMAHMKRIAAQAEQRLRVHGKRTFARAERKRQALRAGFGPYRQLGNQHGVAGTNGL